MIDLNEPDDVMDQRWCCLTCSWKGAWGEVIARHTGLHCPKCESLDLSPADGKTHELKEFHGAVPERLS